MTINWPAPGGSDLAFRQVFEHPESVVQVVGDHILYTGGQGAGARWWPALA
ncbi:hypothetical protein [Actinacidiphila sp. bgisy145]|uniref:hypothetical protein n=1 Tax=Actinacidiphila sp. bgisy145 TaxID=3413792 RepID=UPI003EBBCE63